jgi:two-component sensor histidine kinase/putative methionine-R-sulfoxide reductase with GAF domain
MTKPKAPYNQAVENEILREHQRVLIDLARYATETEDLQRFLDDAVVRVSAAVEIDHVKVLRYRRAQGDLVIDAGIGWNPSSLKAVSFATDMASPPGRTFQTGQPVLIADMNDAPGFRTSAPLKEHNIVSLLNVPIFVDSAVWGVLEIDSTILRGFTDDTTVFLVGVAALIGLVIRRVEALGAQTEAVAAAAQESRKREILLSEIQHRVKNNFQMLLAMLALRSPGLGTDAERQLSSRVAEAIRAMSLAHDQLSPSQGGHVVALSSYLKALGGGLQATLENIAIEVMADEIKVWIEQAVPIGLIVNELVTNSVKHAFDRGGGSVQIELLAGQGPGLACLIVKDNGRGFDKSKASGSGMKLVRALADQIRGRIEQESSQRGTITRLTFAPRAG